jgi:hypothetical protein
MLRGPRVSPVATFLRAFGTLKELTIAITALRLYRRTQYSFARGGRPCLSAPMGRRNGATGGAQRNPWKPASDAFQILLFVFPLRRGGGAYPRVERSATRGNPAGSGNARVERTSASEPNWPLRTVRTRSLPPVKTSAFDMEGMYWSPAAVR